MKKNGIVSILFYLLFWGLTISFQSCQQPISVEWPEVTNEAKPWTRWWWLGSAVNPTDLTVNMQKYADAGFGGLEITPIYGVKGLEDQFIGFLSPQWMDILKHTLNEGNRLNLGIDLANASGWPFGGPWINADDACKNIVFKKYTLSEGQLLNEKIEFIQKPLVRAVGHRVDILEVKFPVSSNENLNELALDQVRFEKELPLQTLMAFGDNNQKIDLTGFVDENGKLNWKAPEGNWNLYALFQGWHGKQVERAGPGGEGNVIDHFSLKSTKKFLNVFDEAAKNTDISSLRAFFNDSYEVDDASGESNWTPMFFDEFQELRGYDLRNFLPALFGDDSEEMNNRILCDFRETISDLLLERYTKIWADWAKGHNAVIRNQAHGSPANILDLYAASDIPETEGTDPLKIKFASSAGHVSGKKLIACEAATWLDEHFLSNLSTVKQNLDRYLANGVNHIVYHGSPYSPENAEWPGWMFYASVHFAPTNSLWTDLKVINEYIGTCQSFMQSGTPDNDILLYFPIYDRWSDKGRAMLHHFSGGATGTPARELGEELLASGFTFDFISDRQIENLDFQNNNIKSEGAIYKTILIPNSQYIPLSTLQKLADLAEKGATVIFHNKLPADVPGFSELENRQQEYEKLVNSFAFNKSENSAVSTCHLGNGNFLMGDDLSEMLAVVDVFHENLAEENLWFTRVKRDDGTCYFISNWSENSIDKEVIINATGTDAVLFDPMLKKMGKVNLKKIDNQKSSLFLQLEPGETRFLQFYQHKINSPNFPIYESAGKEIAINGEWNVTFVEGGPEFPNAQNISELISWTDFSDNSKTFSGTAKYSLTFPKPNDDAPAYKLSLGEVHESASIVLNEAKIGTLVGPEYKLVIDASLLKEQNQLDIFVSNLMANRIADLDKRGVNYKKFYNINFAARKRENNDGNGIFTAINWNPLPSGLLGPVVLTALKEKE